MSFRHTSAWGLAWLEPKLSQAALGEDRRRLMDYEDNQIVISETSRENSISSLPASVNGQMWALLFHDFLGNTSEIPPPEPTPPQPPPWPMTTTTTTITASNNEAKRRRKVSALVPMSLSCIFNTEVGGHVGDWLLVTHSTWSLFLGSLCACTWHGPACPLLGSSLFCCMRCLGLFRVFPTVR